MSQIANEVGEFFQALLAKGLTPDLAGQLTVSYYERKWGKT